MSNFPIRLLRLALSSTLLISAPCFAQASFSTTFDGTDLPAGLSASLSSGFQANVGGGVLTLFRDQIDPTSTIPHNGAVFLTTDFKLAGDFVATVDTKTINLRKAANAGFMVGYPDGFADIFLQGAGGESGLTALIHQVYVPSTCSPSYPGCGSGILFAAGNFGTVNRWRIQRVDSTIYLYASAIEHPDFVLWHSATNPLLAAPVSISVFLDQEYNGTDAYRVEFDNLTISAGSFVQAVPEPKAYVLGLAGLALLAVWRRRSLVPSC